MGMRIHLRRIRFRIPNASRPCRGPVEVLIEAVLFAFVQDVDECYVHRRNDGFSAFVDCGRKRLRGSTTNGGLGASRVVGPQRCSTANYTRIRCYDEEHLIDSNRSAHRCRAYILMIERNADV